MVRGGDRWERHPCIQWILETQTGARSGGRGIPAFSVYWRHSQERGQVGEGSLHSEDIQYTVRSVDRCVGLPHPKTKSQEDLLIREAERSSDKTSAENPSGSPAQNLSGSPAESPGFAGRGGSSRFLVVGFTVAQAKL